MIRARACLALLIAAAAGVGVAAQGRTADGVSAMMRGDYQAAAAILQPIAEDRRQRDPVAAFFMATLYDNGRGVPLDPMRACALYQQAFFDDDSVYAPTAQLLQRRLWLARGNDWFAECQLVANIGIDHRFQPETFTLGAGQSVEWTLTSANVTYENRTKRIQWQGIGRPRGVMFLPVQHVELRPAGSLAPLHYFQVFWWEPAAAQWALRAQVFEVYRDELVTVTSTEALTTSTAAQPPPLAPSDLEALVNLRLAADGAVQLTVGGAHPSTRAIETRADSVAAREKERARAEADARIDWNAALDVDRVPSLNSMSYAEARGCGAFLLFAPSLDRGELITFRANARSLDVTPQPRRYDLAKGRDFSLRVYVYARPARVDPCSDIRNPMPADVSWRAVSGSVDIEITAAGNGRRRATVRILNAEFEGPAGKKVRLAAPIVLTALVGTWAG